MSTFTSKEIQLYKDLINIRDRYENIFNNDYNELHKHALNEIKDDFDLSIAKCLKCLVEGRERSERYDKGFSFDNF